MRIRRYPLLLAVFMGTGSWASPQVPVPSSSASDNDSAVVHRIEADVMPGIIIHTNKFLRGNNPEVRTMNHSFVARLKYAFMPPQNSEQAQIYKGSYQGAGLAFHDFNPQLGHPVSAYLFQGATIASLSRQLSLNYEWDFGLTYGWRPYDREKHPENHVIGSKMTAYINADVYLRWMLNRQWDVNLGIALTHYSNGNTSMPNAGLNVAEARLSLAYYLNRPDPSTFNLQPSTFTFHRQWHTDLTLYGAWKRKGVDTTEGAYAIPGAFGVAGFNVNPVYELNPWLNVGGSLDVQYDHGSNIELNEKALTEPYWNGSPEDIHIPSFGKQISVGLSARAEFVMPYFTINFGIGHNLVNANLQDFKGFYEVLALKTTLTRQFYLHIGYSLYEFYYPNNLMLGLGYHIPWKQNRKTK